MWRLSVLAVFLSSSACISLTPPDRFLVVDNGSDSLKAISPEESKLWVRDFNDDDKGGLAFWHDALVDDLKKNRGYLVVAEADVKDGKGTPGKELVLESSVNGRTVRELLDLFVYGGIFSDTIRVAEYVAEKDTFDKEVDGVRKSMTTLH
ncbi:MAG TPA: hypothetical protein VGO62_11030 [Myxococcota bacterium]|jgi:hypothetical protein